MQNHNDDTIKTNDTVLRKIYLSLYLKGLCVRESWRPNRTAYILTPTLMAISVVSFSFSSAAQLEARGPTLLGAGFLYRILSPTGLVFKLTDFLSSPSYRIVQPPTQYLWNGMFDRHQAEITVMPVHRSLSSGASVYDCTMRFYLVPYCQQSLPTRFLPITAIGMRHFRCLWNGTFGPVEGHYTTPGQGCLRFTLH